MGTIYAILRKDLLIEYRSRQAFLTTLFFGLLVLVVGNFAVSSDQFSTFAPGFFWISFLFSGLLFLNHIVYVEREEDTLSGLILSPATPGHIFLGKMLSAAFFLIALQAILLFPFHILFNFEFTWNSLWLLIVIVLAAIGYCSLGVLFSTMSLGLKNREIILSAILFPVLLPLLVITVKSSIILLNHLKMEQFYSWLKFLAAFDAIYVVLSYWAYFWVLEEV